MDSIDLLEHGGGPFEIRLDGERLEMADPREMHYQAILLALHYEQAPLPYDGIPMWQWPVVFDRWCAAWDLPPFPIARRLAYLVDHYHAALTHDLLVHAGLDLGTEWRARRWRRLSDVIDRLPANSHFSAAVANDEEYAEMLAKAAAERGDTKPGAGEDSGPALTGWTPEVAMLAKVLDAVNRVAYAVVAVQAGKKAGDPPKPERRPQTALERAFRRAEFDRRKAAHDSLVARVLPHKRSVKP
jgi:hypothetical protein